MNRVFKVFAAVVLIAVAWLLHGFYVDYAQNAKSYLLSWEASIAQHDRYVEALARKLVREPGMRGSRLNMRNDEADDVRAFLFDPANKCRLVRPSSPDRPAYDRYVHESNPRNWKCDVEFRDRVQIAARTYYDPGLTYEQALAQVRASERRSSYGMVPASLVKDRRPSATATSKAMWLGVITPFVLLSGALALVLWGLWPRRKAQQAIVEPELPKRLIQVPPPSNQTALAHMLKLRFGDWYPVGVGSATEDDPLILLEPDDYVSLEYQIANFFLSGLETSMRSARKYRKQGADIEALTMRFRRPGQEAWEGERTFYFDITVGIGQIDENLRRSKKKDGA